MDIAVDWEDSAACADKPTDWFFPTSIARGMYDRARAVCRDCPVREECLDDCMAAEGYGLRRGSRHGMFGGLNPKQRDALRERIKVAA
jgi:WhiB family redox-sensing transcriptional regulator